MARCASRGRRLVPRERGQRRRAWAGRGEPGPRRGAVPGPPVRRGDPRVRACPLRRRGVLARARASLPARRIVGPHSRRRHPGRSRAARSCPRAGRAAVVLRRRPGGGALSAGRMPLQALEHLDRRRPARHGPRPGRPLRPAVRLVARGHPRLALPLLPAPARLAGCARGRRARARARGGGQRSAGSPRRHTSRHRSSPSARGTGCSPGRTPSAPRSLYEELDDRANVGQAAQQPRRAELLARQPVEGGRAPRELVSTSPSTPAASPTRGSSMCSLGGGTSRHRETRRRPRKKHERRSALFDGRVDYLYEIGNAQLVLGRALLEQDRLIEAEEILAAADSSFEQLSSVSHRAAVWVAQGDLAQKRGADRQAAHLYRRAAEALQDFRF